MSLSTWLFVIGFGSLNLAASLYIIYRFRLLSEVKELRTERERLRLSVKTLREQNEGFLRNIVAGITEHLYTNISNIAAAAVNDEASTMAECPDCGEWVSAGLTTCPKCNAKLSI